VPASAQEAFACAPENVQHWNKIVFDQGPNFFHPTLPLLSEAVGLREVIVQIDPDTAPSLRQLVVDKLTELGYTLGGGGPIAIANIISADAKYSTICDDGGIMAVVGGMLLQPDSATLVIAYGIANSIWIVPSVAGIGIAVYLVKRKL